MTSRLGMRLVGLFLALALSGCSDSPDESAAPTPPPAPTVIAPSISTQPAAATLAVGTAASFSVVASGTAPLTYQWQRDGVSIAGASASTYSLPVVSQADSGAAFRVVVSNSAGSVTSATAVLSVNAVVLAPTIAVAPQSGNALDGTAATLSVVAQGTAPFTYAWRRNGTAIAGATAATYTTPALTLADSGGAYTVVVSNSAGSVTSSSATITVNPLAPAIATAPASVSVTAGQTAAFSATATGSAPLAYQWRRNGAAIGGATSAGYTTPVTTLSDSGSRFSVVVSNGGGSVTSADAVLTVNAAVVGPTIATAPQNVTVQEGQAATFTANATGSAPLAYQWLRNGTALAGATAAAYTTGNTFAASDSGARFSVRVSNGGGVVTSTEAVLTVQAATSGLIGRAWAGGQALESDDNDVLGHEQAIDDAGRVTVLFQKGNGPRQVLYATRGTPNGPGAAATWSAPVAIDLLNGVPVSTTGAEYRVQAAPSGNVVAYWHHNAACTATTYSTSGTCRYWYFARYLVASGTWEAPTLLTDTPAGSLELSLNDRGDIVFFGSSWVRSGASGFTPALALFMRTAPEPTFRRQLLGTEPLSEPLLRLDGAGNLLLAAQYQQNSTTDIVAYRGTVASGIGTPVVLDTRGAAATLRLANVGVNGQQAVLWTQNNGTTTSTFAATAKTSNETFVVTDLGFNIGNSLTLLYLAVTDEGQALYYEVGFFGRRRVDWSPTAGWGTATTMPDELYSRGIAINRRGDMLAYDNEGRWGTYDASRNVMVQTIRNSASYILGVLSSAANTDACLLSSTGVGFVSLFNRFDVLPTPTAPAGDGRSVANLWGAFLK